LAAATWWAVFGTAGRGAAADAGSMKLPPVTRIELENGLRVLVMKDDRIPLVNLRLGMWGGSASDPPGLEGLSYLTASVVRKGAGPYSAEEFAERVEYLGGRLETGVTRDCTEVWAEFMSKDFEEALRLTGYVVMKPELAPEEFKREKDKLLGRLARVPEEPFDLADREFWALLFGGHPYAHPVDGLRASVGRIKLDDVRRYRKEHYVPDHAVLAIVGDVESQEAIEQAGRVFGSWKRAGAGKEPSPELPPPNESRVLLVDKPDATQTQIRIGSVAVSRADEDYAAAYVANVLFGGGFTSRLVDEIRVNRGLSYSPHSRLYAYADAGVFVIKEYTRNELAGETLTVTLDLLRQVRDEPVGEEELRKTKNYIEGLYPLRLETQDALAKALMESEIYGLGPDYVSAFPEMVDSVTVRDVAWVAEKYLAPDALTITLVGPADSLRSAVSGLGKLMVREARY